MKNSAEAFKEALDASMDSFLEKNCGKQFDKEHIEPFIDQIHWMQFGDSKNSDYEYSEYKIHYMTTLSEFYQFYKQKPIKSQSKMLRSILEGGMKKSIKEITEYIHEYEDTNGTDFTESIEYPCFYSSNSQESFYLTGVLKDRLKVSEHTDKNYLILRAINQLFQRPEGYLIENEKKQSKPIVFQESKESLLNILFTSTGFGFSFLLDSTLNLLKEKGIPLKHSHCLNNFRNVWKGNYTCIYVYENEYAVLCLPKKVIFTENRLESFEYPALQFDDVYLWFVRDRLYPKIFGLSFDELKKEDIQKITNIEMRRDFFVKFGQINIIQKIGAMPYRADVDEYGNDIILYKTELDPVIDDCHYYVQVVCPSTNRTYTIPVPPMHDVRQAVAWTFGKDKNNYKPIIQT